MISKMMKHWAKFTPIHDFKTQTHTNTQLAKSNNNQFKNILKTENLCSMTQIELYITAL